MDADALDSPFPAEPSSPSLPPLSERQRAFLLSGPKAAQQEHRRKVQGAMADALMGGRKVAILPFGDKFEAVDAETGEVIEAGPGEAIELRHAVMHSLGTLLENHAVGLVDPNGAVPHEEGAALYKHSSRLNPNHVEALRRRNRKMGREAVKRAERALSWKDRWKRRLHLRGRHAWSLLTLTLPPVEGATTLLDIRRLNRAFDLFRKREDWNSHVSGGLKGVEDKPGLLGPHVHAHILILATFWDWREIREIWFTCVHKATMEIYGVRLGTEELKHNVMGQVVIDIRAVKSHHKRRGFHNEITLEDALQECIKYITKPEDLADLPTSHLLDLEMVARWPRMFEMLGSCRRLAQEATPWPDGPAGPCFLDTARIFDGARMEEAAPQLPSGSESTPYRPRSWRQLMHELPLGEWVTLMVKRAAKGRAGAARAIQKHRGGIWITLDGHPMVPPRDEVPRTDLKQQLIASPMDDLGDLWDGSELR